MAIKNVISDHRTISYPFPASTAVAVHDLLYNNAGAAAKASAQADQLSEAANQALFASLFLGVSADQRLSTETDTPDRVVIVDGIFDVTCPSTTWAVGDLVGASENSGGDGLENQQAEKVTDPALAIGYCVKPGTSVTTVRCRLISRYLPNSVPRVGYRAGAGAAVTQATSKSTGVTINAPCGAITTHNAALAAGAEVGFTVTNSQVAATDVVVVCIKSGATADSYGTTVDAVAAGSFRVSLTNLSAGSLGEALVINFAVIKSVAS